MANTKHKHTKCTVISKLVCKRQKIEEKNMYEFQSDQRM